MTEYRIAEEHNRFRIQYSNGWDWHDLKLPHVPRYFETLADARSWVATIKKGVVYHDAEDAPRTVSEIWERSSYKHPSDARNHDAEDAPNG